MQDNANYNLPIIVVRENSVWSEEMSSTTASPLTSSITLFPSMPSVIPVIFN